MDKDKIHLGDIKRIILGEAPWEFMAEVFFRTIISYIVILVIVKMLGKRMSGRLTPTEMAVMLMFGAVVSGSMQIPDRGILEATFVLILIVFIQRLITLWAFKNKKFEDAILGTMTVLIKDGVLQTKQMSAEKISRNQLFSMLRSKQIKQLGEIKRVYIETSGSFSIYKADDPPPGLSVLPEDDEPIYQNQKTVDDKLVCYNCGLIQAGGVETECKQCKCTHFVKPVNK